MIKHTCKMEDIEREIKVIQAIWDKRITFGNEGEGDIVCHIGEYWFYFYDGEMPANEITPENIHLNIPIFDLAEMITVAIVELEDDEYDYYCDILNW